MAQRKQMEENDAPPNACVSCIKKTRQKRSIKKEEKRRMVYPVRKWYSSKAKNIARLVQSSGNKKEKNTINNSFSRFRRGQP